MEQQFDGSNSAGIGDDIRHLPDLLARLYARWRDPQVLVWLLEHQTPEEAELWDQNEALIALWPRHWEAILRSCRRDSERARAVATALSQAIKTPPDKDLWHSYGRRLRLSATHRDPAVRIPALTVLFELRLQAHPLRFAPPGRCGILHRRRRRNTELAERFARHPYKPGSRRRNR